MYYTFLYLHFKIGFNVLKQSINSLWRFHLFQNFLRIKIFLGVVYLVQKALSTPQGQPERISNGAICSLLHVLLAFTAIMDACSHDLGGEILAYTQAPQLVFLSRTPLI